jgi:hypothetical protein
MIEQPVCVEHNIEQEPAQRSADKMILVETDRATEVNRKDKNIK